MLGFDALDKIFNRPSLEVEQAQCLNNRYRKAGCTACIDTCPADALAYGPGEEDGEERLRVSLEQCTACGACQGVCPTGALSVSGFSPNTLLLKVKGKSRVAIACPRTEDEAALQVPCLAALDVELLALMGLLGTREIYLQDKLCAACDRGGAKLIKGLAEGLRPLPQSFGLNLQIRLASEGAEPTQADPVESGEVFARRDLFTLFKRQAAEVASVLTEDLVFVNRERPHGLPHRVSAKRLKLLELLRQQPQTDSASSPATPARSVQPGRVTGVPLQIAAGTCDGCGLCAAVCPTGAIRRTVQKDGTVALEQQTAHCIDCGLCLETCPHDAIQRSPALDLTEWLDSTPRRLVELAVHTCGSCGKPFTPSPLAPAAGGLCLQCSTEKSMLDELFGGRRSGPAS